MSPKSALLCLVATTVLGPRAFAQPGSPVYPDDSPAAAAVDSRRWADHVEFPRDLVARPIATSRVLCVYVTGWNSLFFRPSSPTQNRTRTFPAEGGPSFS